MALLQTIWLIAVTLTVTASIPPAAAGATYSLPNWFEWDRSRIDILVVPPLHGPLTGSDCSGGECKFLLPYGTSGALATGTYLAATNAAIEGWRVARDRLASERAGFEWVGGIDLRFKTLFDLPTLEDLAAAEVIVTFVEPPQGPYGGTATPFPRGWPTVPPDLTEQRCVVVVSMWYMYHFSYPDMYNFVAHEVGHCLGLDHASSNVPEAELMANSYPYGIGSRYTPVQCPSNLDALALAAAFATILGQPAGGWTAYVDSDEYAAYCPPE